ncbi:MAG: TrkA family potassium uptake protein [bacterium]
MKTIAVIGLGRFGINLVKELSKLDVEVIAIDASKEKVKEASEFVRHAFICDATNSNALKEVGLKDADQVIITFGQNDEKTIIATVQTTIMVKKLGIKKITVRLDTEEYAETLLEIGATSILYPSRIASERCATKFAMDSVSDYFNVSGTFNVFEITIPETFAAINLMEINTPKTYKLNILMMKRDGKTIIPNKDTILSPNDSVFMFGEKSGVEKFSNYLKTHI